MAQVKTLLAKTCLLTLVGIGRQRQNPPVPAGRGRCRWTRMRTAYGLWNWPPFSDPDLIAREIVKTLACREEPGRHALHTLCDYLKPKSLFC